MKLLQKFNNAFLTWDTVYNLRTAEIMTIIVTSYLWLLSVLSCYVEAKRLWVERASSQTRVQPHNHYIVTPLAGIIIKN